MTDNRIENAHLDNHQRLAMCILSTALDDICPAEEPADNLSGDKLDSFIKEREERRKFWLQTQLEVAEKYEREWQEIETEYETRYDALVAERDKAIEEIVESDNAEKVDERIRKSLDTWDSRRKTLERRLQGRRRGFETRIVSQVGKKYTEAQVEDLRLGLEDSIEREIQHFEARRKSAIDKVSLTRNADRIAERITEKQIIFDMRVEKLKTSWLRKQRLHNKHWMEDDVLGTAVDWFKVDIDMVHLWCLVARIPILTCYTGVKNRLNMLGYSVSEIEEIIKRIKRGEIQEPSIEFYKSIRERIKNRPTEDE